MRECLVVEFQIGSFLTRESTPSRYMCAYLYSHQPAMVSVHKHVLGPVGHPSTYIVICLSRVSRGNLGRSRGHESSCHESLDLIAHEISPTLICRHLLHETIGRSSGRCVRLYLSWTLLKVSRFSVRPYLG